MAASKVCFKYAFGLDCSETNYVYKQGVAPSWYYKGTNFRTRRGPSALVFVAPYPSEMSKSELAKY